MIAICQTKSIAKLIIRISPLLLGLLLFPQVPLLFCVSVHIFGRNVLLYVHGKKSYCPIFPFTIHYYIFGMELVSFLHSGLLSIFIAILWMTFRQNSSTFPEKKLLNYSFFPRIKKHFTDSKFFSSSKRIKSAPLYKQGISYSLQISYSPIDTFPAIIYRKKASQWQWQISCDQQTNRRKM